MDIKPDPDIDSQIDDDNDLEFYDKSQSSFENLYLARFPRYVWEAWQKLTDRMGDEEIQIGTLRTWEEPTTDAEGNVTYKAKLRMLLDPGCEEHHALPREYNLDLQESNVQNHFLFTEEAKEPQEKPQPERRSRFHPYRRPVQKKTKIFGKIHYDVRAEPCNVQEEERYLAQRIFDADNSRSKLQIISRNTASSIINPGTAGAVGWAGNFIKNTPAKQKGPVLKAARIPKNQLLDMIFDCFRQYQYWSVKALRQRTQQPDSYLRQVLEEIAVLNKSGPFANHYCLSEAYRDKAGNDSREAAAEPDEADDEDPEMEDVV